LCIDERAMLLRDFAPTPLDPFGFTMDLRDLEILHAS
jgi:hypothetical protein